MKDFIKANKHFIRFVEDFGNNSENVLWRAWEQKVEYLSVIL